MNSPGAKEHSCFARVLFFLILITHVSLLLPAPAAIIQFSSRQWQVEDGLPNNSVQSITQTKDGYLWIGTIDGLARFDGVKFTIVDLDSVLGPKTGPRPVISLLEDKERTLWIGTDRNGLLVYKDGKMSRPAQSSDATNGSMFKESLAKVVKHSQATCVNIGIAEENGLWKMTIADNGKGFDVQASHNGNGVKNLRRRAEKLQGSLEIRSGTGNGTIITFEKKF